MESYSAINFTRVSGPLGVNEPQSISRYQMLFYNICLIVCRR